MTRVIGLRNVTLQLRQRSKVNATIIDDVSLDFPLHSITSIVGPSGCGKTTLLRLLAGLQMPSSGQVHRPGDIGFVFQKPSLFPWLTAAENVRLPLEITSRRDKDDRVEDLLRKVGLADDRHLYPRQMSGGMQMRASLARALVTRPPLLILDEPLSAMDELLREQLGELILRLWDEFQFTIVMVTHNIAEAIWLTHRVVVMRRGRLDKTFDVPLEWPRDPRVQTTTRFTHIADQVAQRLRRQTGAVS